MKRHMLSGLLVAIVAIVLAVTSTAQAVGIDAGVGGAPNTEFFGIFSGPDEVQVFIPQLISIDPSAGPWEKTISIPLSGNSLNPGATISVWEFLFFAPTGNILSDWHETITGLGTIPAGNLAWVSGTTNLPGPPAMISGPSIWFDFTPPVPDPVFLEIHKDLTYSGPILSGGGTATFTLSEFPTIVPEPSTLLMLGVGAIGVAGFGWRRRRQKVAG